MNGIRLFLLAVAALAVSACASAPQTEVRLSAPRIPPNATAEELVKLGQGQLALGNVALAIESFRKAARNDPSDAGALTGIAVAYERMGRLDLARRYYETALAAAPKDPSLLSRVAAVDAASETVAPRVATPQPVTAARPTGRPRLVRLSLGEVALVTAPGPLFEAPKPPLLALAPATLRREPRIALLNAARVARLAARARAYLGKQGWSGISIGDADAVRETSVIFYPAGQLGEAERLSRKFGIVRLLDPAATQITVLLGRDLAARPGALPAA